MNAITIQRFGDGRLVIHSPDRESIYATANDDLARSDIYTAIAALKPDAGNFIPLPEYVQDLEQRNATQSDMIKRFADRLGCPPSDHNILSAINNLGRERDHFKKLAAHAKDCTGVTVKRDAADRITEIIAENTIENPGGSMGIVFGVEQDGKLCEMCKWSNIGCRNYGEPGKPKWLCHSCTNRQLNRINATFDEIVGKLREAEGPGQEFRAVLGIAYRIGLLGEELQRFRTGRLTATEIHNLCHNLQAGEVTAQKFCDGCEEYQKKLFGTSPIADLRYEVRWRDQLLEQAWGVIANAMDGKTSEEWLTAARKFRDAFHKMPLL